MEIRKGGRGGGKQWVFNGIRKSLPRIVATHIGHFDYTLERGLASKRVII